MPEPRRWLLLRGLTREAGHWGTFVEQLRDGLPGDDVRIVDLPGAGAMNQVRAPATVAGYVGLVRTAMPTPVNLLALSMGAMVALAWARRHPSEIGRLVLINSSHGRLARPWQRLRPGAWPRLIGAALARGERRERRIFDLTSARAALAAEVVPLWSKIGRDRPVTAANAARQLLAAGLYREPLPAPPPPTLVLTSEGDRLVHPGCSRALASALGAELRVHPTAGHDLPLDEPGWVIEQLRGWLSQSDPGWLGTRAGPTIYGER